MSTVRAESDPPLDLQLKCHDGEVCVNRQMVVDATRSPAIKEIFQMLGKDKQQGASGVLTLKLDTDTAADWHRAWKLIRDPLADDAELQGLPSLLSLAEKYELTGVMQSIEACILYSIAKHKGEANTQLFYYCKPSAVPGQSPRQFLQLSFLEQLLRCGLRRAYTLLMPLYHKHIFPCDHYSNRDSYLMCVDAYVAGASDSKSALTIVNEFMKMCLKPR